MIPVLRNQVKPQTAQVQGGAVISLMINSRCTMIFALALVLGGCAQMHDSTDYERHANSRISTPLAGGDFIWYDVKLTPALPLDNDQAERERMVWLQAWLAQRNLCPSGYEIEERRPFEFLEHNPAQMDVRYKVRCRVAPVDID